MKALFLALCFLNIVFFFWEYHKGALNKPHLQQSSIPAILLAEEQDRALRGVEISAYLEKNLRNIPELPIRQDFEQRIHPQSAIPEQPAPITAKQMACYEFGPFSSRKAAVAWLQSQNLSGEIFNKEILIPDIYLVYSPLLKDREQSRIRKMMLVAKGFKDFWVITSGELKGAFGLGIFHERSRAENYKNQLSQRDVQTEIQEQFKKSSSLFVRISTDKEFKQALAGLAPLNCTDESARKEHD